MRGAILGLFVLSSAMTAVGCGGDDLGPLYVETQYQMRCRYIGMCSGVPARDIRTLNGDGGFTLRCGATPASDGVRLDFSAETNMGTQAPYGIELRGFQFRPESGALVGMPTVRVKEDGNTYEGLASASPPADTCRDTTPSTTCPVPCQITGVTLVDIDKGTRLSMQIFCEGMYLTTDPPRQREVTSPSNAGTPFPLTIENCPGL